MKAVLYLAAVATLAAQCVPVDSEFIQARHLAAANPIFAGLPADTTIGRSPVAGARRVLRTDEAQRFAAAHGLPADTVGEVCFEWPLQAIPQDNFVAAMRKGLKMPAAQIEVVESCRTPAPPGELVFPQPVLSPSTPESFLWKGFVRYGDERRFPLWARVRITAPADVLVASRDLLPGQTITPERIETRRLEIPISKAGNAVLADEVMGWEVHRAIRAGDRIERDQLVRPLAVKSGDSVEVQVRNGVMRVVTQGLAEQGGREGEFISVRNPSSGKRFRVRIEKPGYVSVTLVPASGTGELSARN